MSKQHPNVKKLRDINRRLNQLEMHDSEAVAWAIQVCEAADRLINAKGRHAEDGYRRLEDAVNSSPATSGAGLLTE